MRRGMSSLPLLIGVAAQLGGHEQARETPERRAMITVEGTQATDSTGLDADDFLWEKLPGRCCFYGGPDPLDPSKWLGAHSCDQCTVWDLPTNFCHSSASACSACGMTLFCGMTPPLIAGNKVCTGSSRVGHGCEDTLGTGVCASHSLSECQELCRHSQECTSEHRSARSPRLTSAYSLPVRRSHPAP